MSFYSQRQRSAMPFVLTGDRTDILQRRSTHVPNSQKTHSSMRLSQQLLYTPGNYRDEVPDKTASVRPHSAVTLNKSVTFDPSSTRSEGPWFLDPDQRVEMDGARSLPRPRPACTESMPLELLERKLHSLEQRLERMRTEAGRRGAEMPVTKLITEKEALRNFPVTFGESCLLRSSIELPQSASARHTLLEASTRTAVPSETPLAPIRAKEPVKEPIWTDPALRDTGKRVEDEHLMVDVMPETSKATVIQTTPYSGELASLRLSRLRLEEQHLRELKRMQELERIRGPKPKWYELKNRDFHYEANKNNQIVRHASDNQSLFEYRSQLLNESHDFRQEEAVW